MGFGKLNDVVDILNENGLRAQRGYPIEVMPDISGPVASVHMESFTQEYTKVAVQVYSKKNGRDCELASEVTAVLLEELGAAYSVGRCTFDSKTGLFTCRIVGTWSTSTNCTVHVDDEILKHLVAVSVKRSVSREMVMDWANDEMVEECRDMGWNITIEELLPANSMPEEDIQDEFTVEIFRPKGSERFASCKWVMISLESVANGLRRVRVARTWEDRAVSE